MVKYPYFCGQEKVRKINKLQFEEKNIVIGAE